jgi:fructose-1,6-bisphosphatase/inositol monophosphatase family enzyme
MSAPPQSPELKVALQAAAVATEISRRYYHGNFTVTTKADMTPVTQADVECEQAIREVILGAYPDHGFFGEETGKTQADAENLWLVDPIDGTKAFVRQYPFFSTQIALMRDGEIVLGVSSGSMFDEIAYAERGAGAWLNDQSIRVSEVTEPDRAAISTGNLKSLAASRDVRAHTRLRRFLSLSFAGVGQSRRRHRVGREYSRYRGVVRDCDRGGWRLHRPERCTGLAGKPLGSGGQSVAA